MPTTRGEEEVEAWTERVSSSPFVRRATPSGEEVVELVFASA